MPPSVPRRVLHALADSPAPAHRLPAHRLPRLVAAMTDASPAFTPEETPDSYVVRSPRARVTARRWGKGLVGALSAATVLVLGAGFFMLNTLPSAVIGVAASDGGSGPPFAVADPCGLLDTGTLDALGRTELDDTTGTFDHCTASVTRDGRRVAEVALTLATAHQPRSSADLVVVDSCERTTPLREDIVAIIDAVDRDGDPCALADTLMAEAATVFRQHGLPTRASSLPRQSLIGANACKTLDRAQPALGPPKPGFGNWSCQWTAATGTTVTVRFDRSERPPATTPLSSPSGHPLFMTEKSTQHCAIQVSYREFPAGPGKTITEFVDVDVAAKRATDRPCDEATALGTAVAGILPSS
ncbi:hypothetical protein [Amycolatopsis sp. NPDC004378]